MYYLCAVEAMNLENLFGDCEDLSTTRGGGLAVLHIARELAGLLTASEVKAEVLNAGASQGLLRIEGISAGDVEQVVRQHLAQLPLASHITAFVAVREEPPVEQFPRIRAEMTADLRWQQMQSPSVVYPRLIGTAVCDIDRVRPAAPRPDLDEKKTQSDFTHERRQLGRDRKTGILREILRESSAGVQVAEHLSQLVGRNRPDEPEGDSDRIDSPYGNLRDKIALLRFDGNDFGKKSIAAKSPVDLANFSRGVRKLHESYFRRLLAPDGKNIAQEWKTEQERLAIEIVVYGGDEVMFIVPAWLGWKALVTFYDHVQSDPGLTYAGGVVFCYHKTPIHSVKRLASGLVDAAKDYGMLVNGGAKGNFAMYQVLESFDAIGRNLEDFLAERYGFANGCGVCLGLSLLHQLQESMPLLRNSLSRRRLHQLVYDLVRRRQSKEIQELTSGGEDGVFRWLTESKDRNADRAVDTLRSLHRTAGPAALLHVLELWDYAGVELAQAVHA